MRRTVVTLCSGSSGSHVLAADLGRRPGFEVRLLTTRPQDWSARVECEERHVASDDLPFLSHVRTERYVGTLDAIHPWSEVEAACRGADMIVLACPVHSHRALLERIVPALDPARPALLGSLFAQGGFDWIYRDVCESHGVDPAAHALFGLKRFTYLCRKTAYGRAVSLMGRFPRIAVALRGGPPGHAAKARHLLGEMFAKPVIELPNFVCCTLNMSNQVLHAGITASLLKHYVPGRSSFAEPPPVYAGADAEAVANLYALVHEIVRLGAVLERAYGLSIVPHFGADPAFRTYFEFRRHIGHRLEGRRGYEALRDHVCALILRNNRRLEQARLPMKPAPGGTGLVPDFDSRFWLDDIPHGLCVVYGLGAILGVEMPRTRALILAHQGFMRREYLLDPGSTEADPFGLELELTNAPQRYGVRDRASLGGLLGVQS